MNINLSNMSMEQLQDIEERIHLMLDRIDNGRCTDEQFKATITLFNAVLDAQQTLT